MTFRAVCRTGLPGSSSPFRVVDENGGELEWVNHFLDMQCVRGVTPLTLRSHANTLLHFVRWWSQRPGIDITRFAADQFTEATLVDYVYFHEEMPHAPYRLQQTWQRRSPLGYGRARVAVVADLKIKMPQRVMVPLSAEQVGRFWLSFRTARDLAIVALLPLNGLRSREVLHLKLGDLLFSEAQVRVRGKGGRARLLPLPPETIRVLECWLKTERPLTNAPEVFVSLKGKARGQAMTPAGLRSLFRHHRGTSGVPQANPHRFRHTFGSDMIRAGLSLPALQRLMGHAYIHTTLLYVQLTPQDVFAEYARAVERLAALHQLAQ
jgi:integrase